MKLKYTRWFGLIALITLPFSSGFAQAPVPSTSAEVVKMAKSGVTDDVLLAYIKNSKSAYNLSADMIVSLKTQGVSSPVISAMLQHDFSLQDAKKPTVSVSAPTPAPAPMAAAVQQATPPALNPAVPAQTPPPPPPQVEVIPASPGPDYYWNGGYWDYRGGGWCWVGGSWAIATPGIYIGGYYGRPWGYWGHSHGYWGGHRH